MLFSYYMNFLYSRISGYLSMIREVAFNEKQYSTAPTTEYMYRMYLCMIYGLEDCETAMFTHLCLSLGS